MARLGGRGVKRGGQLGRGFVVLGEDFPALEHGFVGGVQWPEQLFGAGRVTGGQRPVDRDQAHVAPLIVVEPVLGDGLVEVATRRVFLALELAQVGTHHQHHGVFVVLFQGLGGRLLGGGGLFILEQCGDQQQALAVEVRREVHGLAGQPGRFGGLVGDQCLVGQLGWPDGHAPLQHGAAGLDVTFVRRVQGDHLVGRAHCLGPFFLGLQRVEPKQCPRALAGVGAEGLLAIPGGGGHVAGVVGGIPLGRQRETALIGRRRSTAGGGGCLGLQVFHGGAQRRVVYAAFDCRLCGLAGLRDASEFLQGIDLQQIQAHDLGPQFQRGIHLLQRIAVTAGLVTLVRQVRLLPGLALQGRFIGGGRHRQRQERRAAEQRCGEHK